MLIAGEEMSWDLNSGLSNANAHAFSTLPLEDIWLTFPPLLIPLNLGRHGGRGDGGGKTPIFLITNLNN